MAQCSAFPSCYAASGWPKDRKDSSEKVKELVKLDFYAIYTRKVIFWICMVTVIESRQEGHDELEKALREHRRGWISESEVSHLLLTGALGF